MGASRARVAGTLLVESTVLGFVGGGLGLLVAFWATASFVHLAPPGIPRIHEVAIDASVLLFALAVSLLSGIASGLLPALRLGEVDVLRAMREGRSLSAGRRTGRTRRPLVVGQVALALMLVFAATALLRSFAGLLDWRPGFPTQNLLTFQVFASTGRYPQPGQVLNLYRQAETELSRLPGVSAVSTMSAGPIFGGDGATPFLVQGRGVSVEEAPSATWYDVGPDYFRVLGVPVVQGRVMTEADAAGDVGVAVINQTMARRYWPGSNPLGATVSLPRLDYSVRIVGVVRDIQPLFRGRPVDPEIYLSNRQRTRWATYFLVRTAGDPHAVVGPASDLLQRLDPDMRPVRPRSMRDIADELRGEPRFDLLLVGLFALVALALGAVGVYGVMAYTVRGRSHEIGIRVALGGRPDQVLRWVLADGLRLLVWGALLGLAGALLTARLLRGLLFGVRPTDAVSLVTAVLLLLLTGVAATLIPAMRAGSTPPAAALRQE
jgi:putative ABC transport system permease protein